MWFDSMRGRKQSGRQWKCRRTRVPTLALEVLEGRFVPAELTVVMSGLDNPRGLAFGPEGALYVAEAGRGGSGPSFVPRPNDAAPGNLPHFYGPSGAISRLWHGVQERVATGLPSVALPNGVGATGPHDIAFQGRGDAFVTIGVGGDPGRRALLPDVGTGLGQLVHLTPNGNWRFEVDVAAHESAANPDGGELNSNPYGILMENAGRVVTDAGGNALLRVAANGKVTTLAVFPSRAGGRTTDAVPTSVVRGPDGAYYVGELSGAPFNVLAARVYRVVPGQAPEVVHAGFTGIIDLDFGPDGSLYVLQHGTGPGLSGSGALVRIKPDGTRTTITDDRLVKPTSVVVDDDGVVYVSNNGIFPGIGEVLRVTPADPAPADPARVVSVDVNDRSVQRSMVNSLTVTFDRVVSLGTGAFELLHRGFGQIAVTVTSTQVNGRTVATLAFSGQGIIGGSLADGNYVLTIRADRVQDAAGVRLDGDGDGVAGGDRTDAFFRLFGDTDGDRDVDPTDLQRFNGAYRSRRGMANYLSYLDFDSDGDVDGLDQTQFYRRLGSYLDP